LPAQPKPEMKFGELAALFLANGNPRPYHVERLKLLLPHFSEVPIGRINRNAVQEYRQARHREKERLSDTTINRDIECLRRILFWAVDEGTLLTNPLSRVPMVRERRKRRAVMSVAEEQNLLAAASGHLREIITAALDTGMRRGEILAQRWEDVELTRKLLFVSHSKTPEGEAREIPLTKRLFELLKAKQTPDGFVFIYKSKPIHRIKTAWRATLRRAGIQHYRFHDLRHTFNTRLMEAGVMQEIRKALMGHSSGEDVQSIYTHVELPAKRAAIEKLQVWVEMQLKAVKEAEESKATETENASDDETNSKEEVSEMKT
jgi:integrase